MKISATQQKILEVGKREYSVNFDKNDAGKFRLKVIKHAEKYGWRSTCDAYGISKSSYC